MWLEIFSGVVVTSLLCTLAYVDQQQPAHRAEYEPIPTESPTASPPVSFARRRSAVPTPPSSPSTDGWDMV